MYDQTSGQVYRLLLRMTRCPETAFDLAQDTFVRAFCRIGQFNGKSTLATWLYRIAVNEALQFLRRKEPRGLPADVEATPSEGASENDRVIAAMDLEEVLQRMDPLDRAVLILKYQEGLDYRAIAAVMGCPIGTVGSRLIRARQRARGLLAAGYEPGEESPEAMHPTEGEYGAGTTTTPADSVRMERRRP
ncbi:MAG: sigma-70 family RNA polymerase sigma factor [Phycisphaerae bacterium]|nr:sigma-70 family RNA polymerase sigma factor [Phycisphaerae bacterium]